MSEPDHDMHPHILNAASNLLGISLIIIAGLHVSRQARVTIADEIAWGAALALAASCILSYLAIRHRAAAVHFGKWADRIFLVGLLSLFAAIAVLASGS